MSNDQVTKKKGTLEMLDDLFVGETKKEIEKPVYEQIDPKNFEGESVTDIVSRQSVSLMVQNPGLRKILETATSKEDIKKILFADDILAKVPEQGKQSAFKDLLGLIASKVDSSEFISYAKNYDSSERNRYWKDKNKFLDHFVDTKVKSSYFDEVYQRTGRRPVAFMSTFGKVISGLLVLLVGAGVVTGINFRNHNVKALEGYQTKIESYYNTQTDEAVKKGINEELVRRGINPATVQAEKVIPLALDFNVALTPQNYVSLANNPTAQKEFDSARKLNLKTKTPQESADRFNQKIAKLEAIVAAYPKTEQAIRAQGLVVKMRYDNAVEAKTAQSKAAFYENLDKMLLRYGNTRQLTTGIMQTLTQYIFTVEKSTAPESNSATAFDNTMLRLRDLDKKTQNLPINTEVNYFRGILLSGQTTIRSVFTDPKLDESETLTFDFEIKGDKAVSDNYIDARSALAKSAAGDNNRLIRAGIALSNLEQSVGNAINTPMPSSEYSERAVEYLRKTSEFMHAAKTGSGYLLDGKNVELQSPGWVYESDFKLAESYLSQKKYDQAETLIRGILNNAQAPQDYKGIVGQDLLSKITEGRKAEAKRVEVDKENLLQRILFDKNLVSSK